MWVVELYKFCREDYNGEVIQSPMYKNLLINSFKECFEYPFYTYDEHFKGENICSFPSRIVFRDYLIGRYQKFQIEKYIKFNTVLQYLTYDETKKKFLAIYNDYNTNEMKNDEFDYCIIASGRFGAPYYPIIPGVESFKGNIIHSKYFKDASQYQDKKVCIVGANLSGEDIGILLYKYKAKKVTLVHKEKPRCSFPEDVIEAKQNITKIDGNKCYFGDDTSDEYDCIILATGYKFHFPYLDSKLKFYDNTKTLYPSSLYKGVVFHENNNLFYLGMQNQIYTTLIFDVQAFYVKEIIIKNINLPDKEEMEKDYLIHKEKLDKCKNIYELARFQNGYIREVANLSSYKNFKIDYELLNRQFDDFLDAKAKNMLTFRDTNYISSITGIKSILHSKPYMEEFDDSYENYVKQKEMIKK